MRALLAGCHCDTSEEGSGRELGQASVLCENQSEQAARSSALSTYLPTALNKEADVLLVLQRNALLESTFVLRVTES